jgi:signal transduction histidine kinase
MVDHPADPVPEPSSDGHPALAWVLLAITISVAALAIALYLAVRPSWHVGQWYFLVDLADAFVYGAVGWLLLSRVGHPVVWIVVVTALGGAVAAASSQWTQLQAEHPELPTLALFGSAQSWAWIPGTLALILIAPWLVRRTPLDVVGKVGIVAGSVVTVGFVAERWTDPYPWPEGSSVMPFAVESGWWVDQLAWIDRTFMAVTVVVGLAAALDVVRRWRSLPTLDARRGLGWLAIGGAVMTITFLPLALPEDWVDWMPVWLTPSLHLVSQLFFPGALLVAVLGQRLWGLQLAISRAVGWSLLTSVLVLGYVTVVAAVGLLVPDLSDGAGRVVAAALVAAAVDPARRFVQRRVDRLVHGEAREPLAAVARVGGRLASARDPELLLSSLLEGVVDSLRVAGASIDVTGQKDTITVGRIGGTDDVALPLVFDDELIGALTVSPRPGERLDQRTRRALDSLLPTLAVATVLAVKVGELAESRARLVSARDEERRAIRRELHDGFGPALAGVGYGLSAVRNLLHTDPTAADTLLERLGQEIDARVEDVRSLARELVPPVLLEAGLVAALEELAERHRASGIPIEVVTDPDLEVPTPMATTLYGLLAEATRNVVRHAGATRCRITVRSAEGCIVAEVRDDGVGFDEDVAAGVGLQSMRERAHALGGRLEIEHPDDGSLVRVTVPLRPVRS